MDAPPPGSRIVFLSPSGWGNLGDAAIIESLIHGVRARIPDARLTAVTLNPEATTRTHGVEALGLLGFSTPFYSVRVPSPGAAPLAGERSPAGRPAAARPSLREAVRERLRRSRFRGALRAVAVGPLRAAREAPHLLRSLAAIRGAEAVVVAGGGQLDELWGGAWGHPWALLRWGLLARAAGARFVVASVGTGSLTSATGRFLVRRALALAEYRSFRDDRSRELAGAARLTGGDPTVPDLAYATPAPVARPPGGVRLVVGLSPMGFCHPDRWPARDAARYRRHVESFGAMAAGLVADGHEVVLFTTAEDGGAVEDTLRAAGLLAPGRLRVARTPSLEALFRTLAGVDLVVAARLHGVLLAHLAHRPVLAVSHERKVRALMEDMGQERWCIDIDGFDAGAGLSRLAELAEARDEVGRAVARGVEERRARVEAQYDRLFGPPRAAASNAAATRAVDIARSGPESSRA